MWAKQIKSEDRGYFVRDARDYALLNGMVLRYPSLPSDNDVGHIPFTLFPSPFPESLYERSLDIHPIISSLMLKIANDHQFMEDTLADIIKVDEFTGNLWNVNQTVRKEGLAQPIISCINRSDYLLDQYQSNTGKSLRLRQVEVNAIASAMSSHSLTVAALQKYLTTKYRIEMGPELKMPENQGIMQIAKGLIDAYEAFGERDRYILMVLEERSANFSDQHLIELEVHAKRPDIRFIRHKFRELPDIAKLGPNRELLLHDGTKEVAVVYFRSGYDPSNYDGQAGWDTRLLLERSRAIKCPSINFHISGAKKFQQTLNSVETLERFLSTKDARNLTEVFCKFWSIEADSPEGESNFKMALESADGLVLKPQREGGGHNIFGSEVKQFMSQITKPEDRSQYILMEHIRSPFEKNWILKHDDPAEQEQKLLEHHNELISELGIYGSILADGSIKLINESSGYLIRSKKSSVKEGGVAAGYAGVGRLALFDDKSQESFIDCYGKFYA